LELIAVLFIKSICIDLYHLLVSKLKTDFKFLVKHPLDNWFINLDI